MQKLIIPIESCFLDGKKPNIAKLVNMNFSADNVKNQPGHSLCKNSSINGRFLTNPMKMCLLGYFCMQNLFLH